MPDGKVAVAGHDQDKAKGDDDPDQHQDDQQRRRHAWRGRVHHRCHGSGSGRGRCCLRRGGRRIRCAGRRRAGRGSGLRHEDARQIGHGRLHMRHHRAFVRKLDAQRLQQVGGVGDGFLCQRVTVFPLVKSGLKPVNTVIDLGNGGLYRRLGCGLIVGQQAASRTAAQIGEERHDARQEVFPFEGHGFSQGMALRPRRYENGHARPHDRMGHAVAGDCRASFRASASRLMVRSIQPSP